MRLPLYMFLPLLSTCRIVSPVDRFLVYLGGVGFSAL